MENKISIITPVYNGEKFIAECIESFIAQNCSQAEHIIVDGESNDKTVDIIKHYAQKYPHIRWISEKDNGQSDAMNKGIKMAKGNIVSFLNADDFYQPNILNRALEIFKDLKEPSLVYGNTIIWHEDEWGNYYPSHLWKPKFLNFITMLKNHKLNQQPPNPSGYFYHKSLHDVIGLYNTKLHYIMDKDFVIKAFVKANTVYVDETWGNFRYVKNTKTFTNCTALNGVWEEYERNFDDTMFDRYKKYARLSERIFDFLKLK